MQAIYMPFSSFVGERKLMSHFVVKPYFLFCLPRAALGGRHRRGGLKRDAVADADRAVAQNRRL
jgi:hypothetical protein